ncbi:DegT/DnrJ/EryC1/StrS family aminotransferase [Bacteroidales bacterium OttesenSCG-928-A17]|nr:DegT/DnrJ/EryC1/StrS family aminotransferase [Bacteroidales bacterium OttesenSCG-928-A17]
MEKIQMVDLTTQYQKIKSQIDGEIENVLLSGQYINGKAVSDFSGELGKFTGAPYVVPCGNGTDALQIALMALDLKEGDEVILPAFTYAAAIEAVALLKLNPVLIDVNPKTFNMDPEIILEAISANTRVILPVHLFGQSCDMEPILEIAEKYGLFVIEDNAQSLGTECMFSNGERKKTGTIGTIGTYSFFPTKNLGCFGDGGAITTNDEKLYTRMKMIAVHGQSKKYTHDVIGCNSRLDTLQAAILNVKLSYLNEYLQARMQAAAFYRENLKDLDFIELPESVSYSTHTYNQFTLKVKSGKRDELQEYLQQNDIPTVVYYPKPIHAQTAYKYLIKKGTSLSVSEQLCNEVLSLPMHTELKEDQLYYICEKLRNFNA